MWISQYNIKYSPTVSLVGYDISQLRLSGKFSHKPSDQRVLQFSTEFRDLEPGNRIYIGASSRHNFSTEVNILTDYHILPSITDQIQAFCKNILVNFVRNGGIFVLFKLWITFISSPISAISYFQTRARTVRIFTPDSLILSSQALSSS